MAIYHFTVKVMSRSQGRNAVAGAAYRHGQGMKDFQTGKVFTNSTHQDVEHCEIAIPPHAPAWAKALLVGNVHQNSQKLWNAVERFEKRVDGQVYRDVEFSLPHELNSDQRLALVREFVRDQFTQIGMIADWCVHNHVDPETGLEKPHVHVMLTLRDLQETPTLEKVKSALGLRACEIHFGHKVRHWNSRGLLKDWRESWAEYANTHLMKAGLDVRIDHRSYADQGIELIPQPKLGKSVTDMAERGLYVDRFLEMQQVHDHNQHLIQKNPEIVLDYITRYQSTFTRQDIGRVLNRYSYDGEEFQHLLAQLEASPKLVRLSFPEGEKFTTQDVLRLERQVMNLGKTLSQKDSTPVKAIHQEEALQQGHNLLRIHGGLSKDQVQAVQHMLALGQLKIVVGHAGAGKTTCLEVAQEAWKQSGYAVVGAAPTGKAASQLETSGIASQTLHKWEQGWHDQRDKLSKRHVLVVDEAGMLDSERLYGVLKQSYQQGFKVVLVGDPEQLPPIEAGAPLRALMETIGFVELSTIVRQQEDWQRQASHLFATRQTQEALKAYDKRGYVHYADNAHQKLITDWACNVRASKEFQEKEGHRGCQEKFPRPSALILAHTNQDVQTLNAFARQEARQAGVLQGPDYDIRVCKILNLETLDPDRHNTALRPKIVYETKHFAVGEPIVFLRNDYDLNVRNGQLGRITHIEESILTIHKNDGTDIQLDVETYGHIDYGYATTIHKSQGTTVDKTFVFASPNMNQHLTYVALTRHKEDVNIYADTHLFKNREDLYQSLSQESLKENALDYDNTDAHSFIQLTPKDPIDFMNRRFLGFMKTSYQTAKLFTQKIWTQTANWMAIYTDLKTEAQKEEAPLPFTSNIKIQEVAKTYGLEPYLNPHDPTHGVYVQFAHLQIGDKAKEEKTILTGIAHHFLTTLERSTGTLDENRLKETYQTASRMAELFQKHQECHTEPLEMVHALRQANKIRNQDQVLEKQTLSQNHDLTNLKIQIQHQETQNQHLQQINTHHISHHPTLGG